MLKSWDGKAGAGKAESITEVLELRTNRKVASAKAKWSLSEMGLGSHRGAQRSQLTATGFPQPQHPLSREGSGRTVCVAKSSETLLLPWTAHICKAVTFCGAEQCWSLLSCVLRTFVKLVVL